MESRSDGQAGRSRPGRRWRVALAVAAVSALAAVLVATTVSTGSVESASSTAGRDAGAHAAVISPTSAPVPSTTTTTPPPPVCDRRPALDAGTESVPAELQARVDAALAHPAWSGLDRSISVWVEGYGEVVAVEPDRALLPASNQKLFTALGAHLLLDPQGRFRTEVRQTDDRLVLVAGGDPTLRSAGPHSLSALAAQVRAAGVATAAAMVVDASHFEASTTARGWQDWQVPIYVGPMSALVVDDNRTRTDAAYLADPALGNATAFAARLGTAGVGVEPVVVHGEAQPTDPVVAALESPTFGELTRTMLVRSDNEVAESLLREIGAGSTDEGLARIAAALEPWCLHLAGAGGDGSGLSRANLRSAREWRRLLQVAAVQPWGPTFVGQLPVAGVSGTLSGRLRGPATHGSVRAKTGSIIGGSALSGYATTSDGRTAVFSVVVNGEPGVAQGSVTAIDRLVAAVVGL
ncbi:D-alanyl-D-alanine carboxypeptidase/D-alanyl-D-alanine endopeptidase [Rhabdothermincola salaria]|uniref:D-alanyl-D-alanine carboxypeptidase/D-alanyl-D-alanine endopeptidase n=1 Tax=Rhabdothermincola salaria TaxID=2903142 RepID=UPI001E4A2875|nr:D-alanyl-D-alanine carboxypeptidase/D-alanyl-D-alanine-endopeptidase [Rhabdothermincola salaria]MCD9624287.1 D-alanyl-D-alanine carboxypeptidase/D-alanyl-D-alanine-endopeptidase [Rhabdothermincola salaria]